MDLPLIVHKDGTIYFYKSINTEAEINISNYLKETAIQIQYMDKLEVYKIEDYSIISLVLKDGKNVEELIRFLELYSYNEIPCELLKHIREIEKNMKVVSLELGKTEIIIRFMLGDLSFLLNDKKINKKLKPVNDKNSFVYPRQENYKLIKYLADNNVNMIFPVASSNVENIDFRFKEKIEPRYYQEHAFDALIKRKKGLTIMPGGAGKTYIGIQLIQYLKKTTLILCENKHNCIRWRELLLKYLDLIDEDISVYADSNIYKLSKINIFSYDVIRSAGGDSIFQTLYDREWGVIIYDNAHKVVTEKAVDLLYLKSKYKFAFDSTLNRSDGRQRSLLNLFGGITYNIIASELINNLFLKKIACYKVDLREIGVSKESFVKYIVDKNDDKSLLVAAFEINDMDRISKAIDIGVINTYTAEEERVELIKDFNNKRINRLCIGNLIENYFITNIDVMISAGYRGGTEIEEIFRIGSLVSTPIKLSRIEVAQMFYLISNDSEKEKVYRKEQYLSKDGIYLRELDVSKFLGDDNS